MASRRAPILRSQPALAGVRAASLTYHGPDGQPIRFQVAAWQHADGRLILKVSALDPGVNLADLEIKAPRGVNFTFHDDQPTGRCRACQVKDHDTCPGTAGCHCCADSRIPE
jgi:hypothetical protein